ncbi:TPA: hypothetical protein DCY83_01270 [Candidatus Wolfebacteria bacterium]|nr:hypothetical protein [Candidatus Wolfebacteria bacterium]HBD17920.1 hypothetical protein [Candidatus Wolfebacteria bacterium]
MMVFLFLAIIFQIWIKGGNSMPDCVQLVWHENVLKFMGHEIRAAHTERRLINSAVMHHWVEYIRTTKKTSKERRAIVVGLDQLLSSMPNDEATLFSKLDVKTLRHYLEDPPRRICKKPLPIAAV